MSHGGPTAATYNVLRYMNQFWTTRGFAVLDVNYGGSTGYGRAYRERLKGQWGVVDVADCVNGARYLVAQGLVDGNRLAITGGSAGGFTVLQALIEFPDTFKAGINLYGVSDQFGLVPRTHKFEARYSDSLLGPLPEAAEVYRQRSPLLHADQIKVPLAVFHGPDDEAVGVFGENRLYGCVGNLCHRMF